MYLIRIILACVLLAGTISAQLPPKVIGMKDSLFQELQSLPEEAIPQYHEHQQHHSTGDEIDMQVQRLIDEFLDQNQRSIEAVLRVLQLIDHDLENVIQDCVRIFDIDSLQSTNSIFVNVTKPLLVHVRELCVFITDHRIEEIEASLVEVQREASEYRQKLDQTLQHIATISMQLHRNPFAAKIQLREAQIMDDLMQMNHTLMSQLDQNFTTYFTKWIGGYKNFTRTIPEDVGYNSDEQPEIAHLFDFLDLLDNETTVLQDELEEFLDYWFYIVEETLESIKDGSVEIVEVLSDYPLEDLLSGQAGLQCVADYYQNFEPTILRMLDGYFQCVDYEEEMRKAFQQIASVLDSTDKAITFLMGSYVTCAKLATQYNDLEFSECLEDLSELLEQTREFIEHKASEIYYHVEDAMVFNGVIMEACVHLKARDTVLHAGDWFGRYNSCSGRNQDDTISMETSQSQEIEHK